MKRLAQSIAVALSMVTLVHANESGTTISSLLIQGEVHSPGSYSFTNEVFILDAINAAGGTTENAMLDKVNILRKISSTDREVIPVNVMLLISKADMSMNIPLLNGDIVMFPKMEDETLRVLPESLHDTNKYIKGYSPPIEVFRKTLEKNQDEHE